MKKILFLIMVFMSIELFAASKLKGFKSSNSTHLQGSLTTTASALTVTENSAAAASAAASSSSSVSHVSAEQGSLLSEPTSSKRFTLDTTDDDQELSLAAPPNSLQSPITLTAANNLNEEDDCAYDGDDNFEEPSTFNKYRNTLLALIEKTTETTEQLKRKTYAQLGLSPEYEIFHQLAIEGKLKSHLAKLNEKDPGAAGRCVDSAINTAIKHDNEKMLKYILLDIEELSKTTSSSDITTAQAQPSSNAQASQAKSSPNTQTAQTKSSLDVQISQESLSRDTKKRISKYLIQCSAKRRKIIIDLITTYLHECDQDACLIRRFRNSEQNEQHRHSYEEILQAADEIIDTLTKYFSGETLLPQRK